MSEPSDARSIPHAHVAMRAAGSQRSRGAVRYLAPATIELVPGHMKHPSSGGSSLNAGKDTDMTKTHALDLRIMPRAVAVAAMALLLAAASVRASAWGAEPGSVSAIPVALLGSSSTPGHSFITSRGPAFITGHVGSMDTVMLPGSGAQGFLMDNGNGSSTLFAPGGAPQTVISPR
jgi:hypothetical protein